MSFTPFIPAIIMFSVTALIVGLCCLPLLFSSRSKLLNFYWAGFWGFIAMIAATAGGEQGLLLAGVDILHITGPLKVSMTLCFVLFVVFGWFRLTSAALVATVRRVLR